MLAASAVGFGSSRQVEVPCSALLVLFSLADPWRWSRVSRNTVRYVVTQLHRDIEHWVMNRFPPILTILSPPGLARRQPSGVSAKSMRMSFPTSSFRLFGVRI